MSAPEEGRLEQRVQRNHHTGAGRYLQQSKGQRRKKDAEV